MKFDPSDEPVDVDVEVPTLVHLDGIAIGQRGETRRQLSLAGHSRAVDLDRDDGDVPLKCGLDLDPDVIARVCQPACVGLAQPPRPHHHQKHLAPRDLIVDELPEVDAEGDGVDVHHDRVITEVTAQPVVDPSGHAG